VDFAARRGLVPRRASGAPKAGRRWETAPIGGRRANPFPMESVRILDAPIIWPTCRWVFGYTRYEGGGPVSAVKQGPYRSSGRKPACFATPVRILRPRSSLPWKANS
jgi:hypothetical protein